MTNQQSVQNVIGMIKEVNAEFLDLRFTDVPGMQHHFTLPVPKSDEDIFALFEDGIGFDGSSIRGFQSIDKSDMILMPDPDTAVEDLFYKHKTIIVLADVIELDTKDLYDKDPRVVSHRANSYMQGTGIADTMYIGPELEFFIFDGVSYTNQPNSAGFNVESLEAVWSSDEHETIDGHLNPGHHIPYKRGYLPLPPMDSNSDLRSEMVHKLQASGIAVEMHHHEVGTGGQSEMNMIFDSMIHMADKVQLYKYIIRNAAKEAGKTATFMPKPLYGENGSGMHTHQSLWKDGKPLFYDENGYANLSELALYYIGGILKHAPAVLAFSSPSTNSYKRLLPGYEAPVDLVYSKGNRSAAVRIPLYSEEPKGTRIEFRCPDPSANPYLAFSAMLMAGLDGIKNKIHPGDPLDVNVYELSREEHKKVKNVPATLREALVALENDHDFLMEGEVFSKGLIDSYLELKFDEVAAVSHRPNPMEFELYFSS